MINPPVKTLGFAMFISPTNIPILWTGYTTLFLTDGSSNASSEMAQARYLGSYGSSARVSDDS